jgi:hypothetical protein
MIPAPADARVEIDRRATPSDHRIVEARADGA